MKKRKIILEFINCYFRLFDAKVKNVIIKNNVIGGKIFWPETNEFQQFLWNIPQEEINYQNIIELIDYLIKNNLINIDKIIISKENLVNNLKKIKWSINNINNTLYFLCSIRIAMVENEDIIDYFFVHF